MPTVLETIALHAVVPAIVLQDLEQAEPLGHALLEGGLPVAEITLRTPTAITAIE